MKTYIALTKNESGSKMIAVEAKNKKSAFNKIKDAGFKVNSTSVRKSAFHIDYVNCDKLN